MVGTCLHACTHAMRASMMEMLPSWVSCKTKLGKCYANAFIVHNHGAVRRPLGTYNSNKQMLTLPPICRSCQPPKHFPLLKCIAETADTGPTSGSKRRHARGADHQRVQQQQQGGSSSGVTIGAKRAKAPGRQGKEEACTNGSDGNGGSFENAKRAKAIERQEKGKACLDASGGHTKVAKPSKASQQEETGRSRRDGSGGGDGHASASQASGECGGGPSGVSDMDASSSDTSGGHDGEATDGSGSEAAEEGDSGASAHDESDGSDSEASDGDDSAGCLDDLPPQYEHPQAIQAALEKVWIPKPGSFEKMRCNPTLFCCALFCCASAQLPHPHHLR